MPDEKKTIKGSAEKFISVFKTRGGEEVYLSKNFIVIRLPAGRNALTTSWINGGYRENLEAVFNHQLNQQNINDLEEGNIADFMKITAVELGLNPEKVTGLITVASMENYAISNKIYRDLEVTAIVTAGIEVNGGRAGDPASYYEENGKYEFKVGTINTILIINASLCESTLARAMMTAVEAKTVALQQLMAQSRYSSGIATGSGTDKISVISNLKSDNRLTNAGKHSKLGELIGRSVIEATSEALAKQSNLTPDTQCDMLVRLERFRIDEELYWKAAREIGAKKKGEFLKKLHYFSKNPAVVAMIASVLHIVDEINWKLIPELDGKKTAISIMKTLPEILEIEIQDVEKKFEMNDSIIDNWIRISLWCMSI